MGYWLPETSASSGRSRILTLEENEREQIVEVIDFTGRRVTGRKGTCQDPRNETNDFGIEDEETRHQAKSDFISRNDVRVLTYRESYPSLPIQLD